MKYKTPRCLGAGLTFVDREIICYNKIGYDFVGPNKTVSNVFSFSCRSVRNFEHNKVVNISYFAVSFLLYFKKCVLDKHLGVICITMELIYE